LAGCLVLILLLKMQLNSVLRDEVWGQATEPVPQERQKIRAVQINSVVDSVGLILLVKMRLKLVWRNQVGVSRQNADGFYYVLVPHHRNPTREATGVLVATTARPERAGPPDIARAGPEFPAKSGGSSEPYAAFF